MWRFELGEVVNILIIVGTLGAWFHYFVLKPYMEKVDTERLHEVQIAAERYARLDETLRDLKNEINISRKERMEATQKIINITARIEVLEDYYKELKEEMHACKNHERG